MVEAPGRARRGPGLRLRGEDGRRRSLRDRRRPHARRSPARRGEGAADPLRARLLDGSRAVLRAGARRRQEAGPSRDEQRRARPLVRDREPRARRRLDEAPHGARHVHRMGHPDALEQVPDVQPDELSQRIGVAARQLPHRSRLRALRSARGGGRGGGRVDRGRPPLSECAASRALVRFPAGSPVLVAAGRLPRVVHPAGVVRGDGLSLPARAPRDGAGPEHAAPLARPRPPGVARSRRRSRYAPLRFARHIPRPAEPARRSHRGRSRPRREGGCHRVTRRRPRVVLVHYTAPSILGGVEQVMGVHATALREAGADVTIVAGRGRAPKGVRLARIPEVDSRNESVLRDFRSLAQGERTKAHDALVDRLVRKLRPIFAKADRVVVHNVMTMHKDLALTEALVRLARERPGVVIAWTHDLAWSDPQYANERHPGDPWGLIARAHPGIRYVAVSDERADQLAALAGLRREGVAVVPNGVDIAAALGLSTAGARLAEQLDLYRADPLLVLPARLTRRKRIEAAIAATAALRGRGHQAMLVVTGPPGPHNAANAHYLAELAALAEGVDGVHLLYALGLKAPYRVVADLYALGDALVLPSQSEGFGIPLLEAALHRLSIVCSDLPTLRALAGDAATYVPPDASGEVIADAIERSLGQPGPRFRSRVRAMAWSRVLAERVVPLVLDGIA